MNASLLRILVCTLLPARFLLAEEPIPEKIEFNRDVRPFLSDTCFKCHGFDPKAREADRRMDTREAAMEDHDGVRAIVPGDLAKSDAWLRVSSTDKDEQMPPAKSGKKLTPRQIAIFKRWIEQGAEYQAHWSYAALERPSVPKSETPNPVDAFARARLATIGLTPSPEADRTTLLRRVSFDLTGLPPTPAEVDAFVNDKAADAYEKVVTRLLASPAYGERMAVSWLDLVRYADTIGFHSDNPRNVTPYRDYVIRAFNENKPFDKFTVEQLAGDLLPNSGTWEKVASAFNRLNLSTGEGGAQAKDYEQRTVADRVRAIGTVWLGQTTGCAQCHDHKFDPITTRDFYRLGAFFADIKENAIGVPEEGMLVAGPEQEAKIKEADAKLAATQARLDAATPEISAAQAAWEATLSAGVKDVAWTPLQPEKLTGEKGTQFLARPDGSIKVETAGNPPADTYRITVKTALRGINGFKLEALPSASLPASGPGRAGNGNFVLNEFIIERDGKPLKLAAASATFEQPLHPASTSIDGKLDVKTNGWAVMGNAGKEAAAYFELAAPIDGDDAKPLTFVLHQALGDNHTLGKFRISATVAPKPIRAPNVQAPPPVVAALAVEAAKRTDAQRAEIAKHFRSIAPQLAPVRAELAQAQAARTELEKGAARCIVSTSAPPRVVRVLPRGDWQNETGEIVEPGVPAFLPQPKVDGRKLTRLDLGQWLVAKENPLTARVFVNRLWKMYFGTGLSKVLDDVGSQGELPNNAALIDWLASEFVDSGWDMKHIVRTIVTSQTYRQTSRAAKELQQRDPDNRDLARQSRFRLEAEFVRDNALAISGLLVRKLGGLSVKPYQPPGYWENLNFPVREWENDKNENQWRRGLYTWWQRSYLQPSLLAFDAPSREECTAERVRSNIPQQALVLLNDPTYVEAARVFAQRILAESTGTPDQRIAWAWREATSRAPLPEEIATVREVLDKHLAQLAADSKPAEGLLKVGLAPVPAAPPAELAAWTNVARILLNLHETITRS